MPINWPELWAQHSNTIFWIVLALEIVLIVRNDIKRWNASK